MAEGGLGTFRLVALVLAALVSPVIAWTLLDDGGSSHAASGARGLTGRTTSTTATTVPPPATETEPPPAEDPPAAEDDGGCHTFPADNYWNTPVAGLPAHPNSPNYVASIGASTPVKADFGSGTWDGGPIGIPVTEIDGGVPEVAVSFDYADESDPGPYPIPADVAVEGGPDSDGDRHVLVVDRDRCRLYELWDAHPNADGSWHAGSGAVFDLDANALRPDGWTSADAAGLPVTAGLVRFDEVAAGRIDHAIRVTVPRSQASYLWPARHAASEQHDTTLPPMGLRLRLRSDVDLSGFPEQARVIAEAMRTYGVVVADNGSAWYISGEPDERWDNDALRALGGLTGLDFEAVDTAPLMVDPASAAVQGAGA